MPAHSLPLPPVLPLLTILFFLCLAGVLHTYVFFPWWIRRAAPPTPAYSVTEAPGEWPRVAVLMAAHNEAAVIAEKLRTLREQDYAGRMDVYVGSDCSSDGTNDVLQSQIRKDWRSNGNPGEFTPYIFTERRGKPGIINQLAAAALPSADVYVITDASVMLSPSAVRELISPLVLDAAVGVVDARMVQVGARAEGIGRTEEEYINREVAIKVAEGAYYGRIIGPFGGCWALRSDAYTPVPANFLVDDFFLCMSAYEKGFKGVTNPAAEVHEAVGQRIDDEYRRKVRISAGNWQNLNHFRDLWLPPWKNGLAFAFFSHKILRWLTPILLLTGALAAGAIVCLTGNHYLGAAFALLLGITVGAALLDIFLQVFGVHLRPLRAMRYFLAMNVALLHGLFRYLTGITTNVWQPSARN